MAFAPSSFFVHHPIHPDQHYTLRVKPIHGCSKCGRLNVFADIKDNFAILPLRPCKKCGVARYCSNVCQLTDRFSIADIAHCGLHGDDVCKPPSQPVDSKCTVVVGDVDVFREQEAFRAAVLNAAQQAACKKLDVLMKKRQLLMQHRPVWTFQPLYLLFDLYHPGQVWVDEPDQVFNGHAGLIAESKRVLRILRRSSPKYIYFAFALEPVHRTIDLICINAPLSAIKEEPTKAELKSKIKARRKKK